MKRISSKTLLYILVRIFGMRVRDAATGEDLGKYLFVPWFGRLLVFGFGTANDKPFYPVFLKQKRLTYSLQELGFRKHPQPDFLNERHSNNRADAPDRT